jgi:phosphoribosylamine---glycine ligase
MIKMRVLIVGSGGREHALSWKLATSDLITKLYCAPGNPGTNRLAEQVNLAADDLAGITKWAVEAQIDLVVIGPEVPLVLGLADLLRQNGIKVFGPGKMGAQLEGSKVWAKRKMKKWGIPTADFAVFDDFDEARHHLACY